ncbi:hypothetical protein MM710_31430, partial [Klebsiella pneumoniae]|nr:hypothetical protein [Klebsiella pneumoniae]
RALATRLATFLMRSGEPTDVPPYLCTINAMFRAFLCGIGRAAWFAGKAAIITIFYMKFKNGLRFPACRLTAVSEKPVLSDC